MKINRGTTQLGFLIIGLVLIIITYFLYPQIEEKKYSKVIIEDEKIETTEEESNTFQNVEYKGLYDFNNEFIVKSEKARILTEEPDIVYMTSMKVVIEMKDGRFVVITSDSGRYNKSTYDCFFVDNVKATDEKTIIFADNLDLLSSKDLATVYNNVILNSERGTLTADIVHYDFETKRYKISMLNDEKVKIKLVEWVILKNLE